ncbi:MAG: Amuc_1100 family pilus-like protein [Terrimicrobiaceae bacterium]|nr:Amuc_1100 family pilus-like protein [Terrimicrobiaceae bacterium]
MNWFKENPFVSGLLVVAILGAGALGYLIMQASSSLAAASEGYTAAVSRLHSLQNRVPFPNDENLGKLKEVLADYEKRISGLRGQLSEMELPLNPEITPQQFQDDLRTAVNELRTRAAANNVKLPDDFYFGFSEYQAQVPSPQAAPYLDRQLRVIRSLVNRLVDFKVSSIDGLTRQPLPQEGGATAPAATSETRNRPADKAPKADPILERFPFEIAFTAEQGKVRVAFNSILGKEHFLVVRSLGIQNTNPEPPSRRTEGSTSATAPNPFATDAQATSAQSLQVILGRELVRVTLRLEMLDFLQPPEPKN